MVTVLVEVVFKLTNHYRLSFCNTGIVRLKTETDKGKKKKPPAGMC